MIDSPRSAEVGRGPAAVALPLETPALTLYQFELCPYCHKVRAGLEAKGLAFTKVEVNPMSKRELPPLSAGTPRKVPVLAIDGVVVQDSTAILDFLDQRFPEGLRFLPTDPAKLARTREIEAWVDDDLIQVLPTVIYGKWGEAFKAAQVTARTSNFGLLQNLMVRGGGSLIMHQVAKRIVKRRGGRDPRQMLEAELDKFESWLGDQPFVCGEEATLGDVAAQGAFTCVKEFPAWQLVVARPRIAAWYARVQVIRETNRRIA